MPFKAFDRSGQKGVLSRKIRVNINYGDFGCEIHTEIGNNAQTHVGTQCDEGNKFERGGFLVKVLHHGNWPEIDSDRLRSITTAALLYIGQFYRGIT